MEPELEKLLEKINPERLVTGAEAKLLKKLKKIQSEDPNLCMEYLIRYCNAKHYRDKKK